MRRSATTFLTAVLLVSMAGCQEPQQEEDMQEPAVETAMMEPDLYVTDPAAATAGNEGASYTAFPEAAPAVTDLPASSTAIHVVARGDTLYGLARHYYNDQRRWKDIYEANAGKITNPDLIKIGQELVIP